MRGENNTGWRSKGKQQTRPGMFAKEEKIDWKKDVGDGTSPGKEDRYDGNYDGYHGNKG